jgi:uncharacterized membrane protein
MKKRWRGLILVMTISLGLVPGAWALFGPRIDTLTPENDVLKISLSDIDDGKAHYFKVTADSGTLVTFFTLKSRDGVIRAAIDACDVCYRSGKGYVQDGDFMVCTNCGQRFASSRINVVKGGCNPAPLNRQIDGKHLLISMADINQNAWYCEFKKS